MRRMIFPGTLVLIAALLLAACGGATVQTTPGVGDVTPSGAMTLPAATEPGMPSPEATEPAATEPAATEAVTEAAATEPAAETATEAPTEGATAEATSSAGTDATPVTQATAEPGTSFVRLTALLQSNVNAGSGEAGEVDGVLVEHPEPPIAIEEGTPAAETPTPEPTVENAVTDFTLRYVLVDTRGSEAAAQDSAGQIVLVPWSAFDFSGADTSVVTLRSDMAALTDAPHFSLTDIASNRPSLGQEVADYWSGQGIAGIPMTGAGTQNLALIPGDFRGISIADAEGTALGAVNDFVIDAATGQIVHVVVNGGAAFNNQEFIVPLDHLTWSGNTGMQLGSFQFNFPSDVLQNIPQFDLNNLTLDKAWLDTLNQFWNSVQGQ